VESFLGVERIDFDLALDPRRAWKALARNLKERFGLIDLGESMPSAQEDMLGNGSTCSAAKIEHSRRGIEPVE